MATLEELIIGTVQGSSKGGGGISPTRVGNTPAPAHRSKPARTTAVSRQPSTTGQPTATPAQPAPLEVFGGNKPGLDLGDIKEFFGDALIAAAAGKNPILGGIAGGIVRRRTEEVRLREQQFGATAMNSLMAGRPIPTTPQGSKVVPGTGMPATVNLTTPTEVPSTQTQAPVSQQQAQAPLSTDGLTRMRQLGMSVNYNPYTGKMSATISGRKVESSFQKGKDKDGRNMIFNVVTDPATGQVISAAPIFPAGSDEGIAKAELYVNSVLGVPTDSPVYDNILAKHIFNMSLTGERRVANSQVLAQEVEMLRKNDPRLFQGGSVRQQGQQQAQAQVEQQVQPSVEAQAPTTQPPTSTAQPVQPNQVLPASSFLERSEATANRLAADRRTAVVRAETEAGAVSGELAKVLAMQDSLLRQVGIIEASYDPSFVGKVGGFLGFMREVTPEGIAQFIPGLRISPAQVDFIKTLEDIADSLVRARSGAQINEDEFRRLRSILPRVFDKAPVFERNLRRFRQEFAAVRNNRAKLGVAPKKDLKPIDPSIVPIAGKLISRFESRNDVLNWLKTQPANRRSRIMEALELAFP